MNNYARWYVLIGLFWLTFGMVQGFWMGATNELQYKSTHVAIMMLGFVLPVIFGGLHALWPELGAGALPKAQFWLTAIGGPINMLGALQLALTGGIVLAVIGSSLLILGAALLLYLFAVRVALAAADPLVGRAALR